MLKRIFLAFILLLSASGAWAQNPTCPTRLIGDESNACASTAFVQTAINTSSSGKAFKAPVKAATTANITLSGAQTIDGISIVAGDRVLVKNQTSGAQNGIYTAAAGAWARSSDGDLTGEFVQGSQVRVAQGTIYGGVEFAITTADIITIGSTAITWDVAPAKYIPSALSVPSADRGIHTTQNSSTSAQDVYVPITVAPNFYVDNYRSVVNIATGTTAYNSSAYTSYLVSNNAITSPGGIDVGAGVGYFGISICNVDNCGVWGGAHYLSDNTVNAQTTTSGRGIQGWEWDFTTWGTGTTVTGTSFLLGGTGSRQPTLATAVQIGGSGNDAVSGLPIKWRESFVSRNGRSEVAFAVGATAESGTNIDSQPIRFYGFNGAAALYYSTLSMYNKSFFLTDQTNQNGFIFSTNPTGTNPSINSYSAVNTNLDLTIDGQGTGTVNLTKAPKFASLTGYVYANGVSAATASTTIPTSVLTGVLPVANGGTNCSVASGTCLDNITSFSTTGMMARTGVGTYAFRTLTGTAAEITITQADGLAGNPTFSLPTALTFTGKTVTGGTFSGPTLSGTVAGTPTWASNQAITLSTAAQPNITSLGTLTGLTMSGAINMGTNGLTNVTSVASPNNTNLGVQCQGTCIVGIGTTTTTVLVVENAIGAYPNLTNTWSSGFSTRRWSTVWTTNLNINSATMMTTATSFTNGAGAGAGTISNAPAAGNPTKWIPIDDNGTTRYIPAW